MVTYNDVDYFYVYNLQGDVVALIDANGTQVVEYGYDAWGNSISKTGSLAATIGTLNPFRYRGCVYDEETGLYYLRSRYYSPSWKRFVNADDLVGTIGTLLCHNQYSYCGNSPILYSDQNGHTFAIGIYEMVVVSTGLTVHQAKVEEQTLISVYSLEALDNARREIAVLNLEGFREEMSRVAEIYGSSIENFMDLLGERYHGNLGNWYFFK